MTRSCVSCDSLRTGKSFCHRCTPTIVLAQQGLERMGRQYEVRNDRHVVALDWNISFCIVFPNSCCAVSFGYDRTLPIRTCQSDMTRILASVPLELPQNRLLFVVDACDPPSG